MRKFGPSSPFAQSSLPSGAREVRISESVCKLFACSVYKESSDGSETLRYRPCEEAPPGSVEAYVYRALQNVDDFNLDFQRILTEYCRASTWGDETLQARERSILNLGMIAALGKMEEFATHVRGALNNGLMYKCRDDFEAVSHPRRSIYRGAPIGSSHMFRVARG